MNDSLILSAPLEEERAERARRFCADFCAAGGRPKYVLGRNVYAESVARSVELDGFIDDYASGTSYLGRPTVKSEQVPRDALVLVAAGGRPFTARARLQRLGLESLDYFAFYRYSGKPLLPIVFNEGFAEEFEAHRADYDWIHGRLHDEASRTIFRKLVSFRLKYDLELLDGFTSREDEQYFEDFLRLRPAGESFADVGCYNGFNSLQFTRLCPDYRAVHVFEPEPVNYSRCVAALAGKRDVHFHQMGLSNRRQTLRLDPQGSGSRISDHGPIAIPVDRMDDVLQETPSLIKMDIEGAEHEALEGAAGHISRAGPRLALGVYHAVGDFWRLPRRVLEMRPDYDIYLRHYTETIYETVMFFVPGERRGSGSQA